MNLSGYLLNEKFATVASESLLMLAAFLAPWVLFAALIHWFEQLTQRRLAGHFGWNSVLWTGWLGTPVHELSHVLACLLFRHRIDEVVLFEPDRESGRLGYVKHSYRHDNWFERLGNVFIGIAPLFGGSVMLAGLLWLFYPDAIQAGYQAANPAQSLSQLFQQVWGMGIAIAGQLFQWNNLMSARFWLFLYLVLCVSSHMAPSGSDYRGASQGASLAVIAMLGTTLLLASLGIPVNQALANFLGATAPLFTILSLAVVLCGLTTLLVILLTSLLKTGQQYLS